MGISARIDELRKKFEENPRRYFAPLANEYRKAGDLEQAIDICRQHLAEQPGHMSGHIVFGQALFEAGQLDEAQQIFSAALALDPENLIALRHLGDIARGQGEARAAQAWYQRVLDADPRNEEIAAIVRELAAQVPLEGFAGMPTSDASTDDAPAETATIDDEPEALGAAGEDADRFRGLADAPTVEFVPPRWPTPAEPADAVDDAPGAPLPFLDPEASAPGAPDPTVVEAGPVVAPTGASVSESDPSVAEADTAESPVFEPLDLPTSRPSVVLPASALPPERVVEPLPNTLEIPQVDAQRWLEAARAGVSPAEDSAATDELEMPSADELRHPTAPHTPEGDPLADLPMEMLEGFGEASAESLLASGRAAPAPESPLGHLEADLGDVSEPEPLIGGGTARADAGLEFMENPLGELASSTRTPPSTASALDAFEFGEPSDALAPEPPLPPPLTPTFEPAEPDDPVAAPRASAAIPRVSEPIARIPTPVAAPAFVTEAMGELLEQQGLHAQAADVYRTLLADRPGDARLSQRLAAVEAQVAPTGWSAREWLQQVAAVRLPTGGVPGEAYDPPVASPMTDAPMADAPTADVPSFEPPVAEPALAAVGAGSLEALFGAPTNPADEAAAVALAALFDEAAAIPGAPTTPAGDELSLKAVFEPPAAPAPRTSAAFSFDQFFAAAPKAATPAPGGGDAELAEFTRWLDGLKKQ